jgi:hypothetical protein
MIAVRSPDQRRVHIALIGRNDQRRWETQSHGFSALIMRAIRAAGLVNIETCRATPPALRIAEMSASQDDVPWFPGPPRQAFRLAEQRLHERRAQAPDLRGAIAEALETALGTEPAPRGCLAAGRAIADAIEAHGAAFRPGTEPAYHDRHHQADVVIAMGWLAGTARRMRSLKPQLAAAGVLAMAGHDLLHDGSAGGSSGRLEARSAAITAELARHAGLDDASIAAMRRVILATDIARPAAVKAADDLLCRLGQEADLFASLTPELGWLLSEALAHEWRNAGVTATPPVDSFAGRLGWLRGLRPPTRAGEALGLAVAAADQRAAFAWSMRELVGLAAATPDQAAAALDALPRSEARRRYLAALRAVAGG